MKFKVVNACSKIKAKQRVEKYMERVNAAKINWDNRLARVAMIQELIPLGLLAIETTLQDEVEALVGGRMSRGGDLVRWGYNPGSAYLGSQNVSIRVPRVRNRKENVEIPLQTYEKFQDPKHVNEAVFRRVINGISMGKYEDAAEAVPEAFGQKPTTVSRRFIRAAKSKLNKLIERDLSNYDIVAIIIDGKAFGDNEIIIAVGITMSGEKIVLGIIESASEHHRVCEKLINGLIDRKLRIENEILFIIDGAKGLRKGIKKALGAKAVIQRCQWHKRENVVDYLPKKLRDSYRKKMASAYRQPTEARAKKALARIGRELKLMNESAYNSLMEGLDETLTVNRLGLNPTLAKALRTTNAIENINSLIGGYTDRVDHWKTSNQRQRWVATALLEIEPKLLKLVSYRNLGDLRKAMKRFASQFPVIQTTDEAA